MGKGKLYFRIIHKICYISAVCVIVIGVLPIQQEANAHPHAFIAQRLNMVFDHKGLAGIRVWWKFDDMFASMIAEDHDINRNGSLETEEVSDVKKEAFDSIAEFNYFSFIKIDKRPFKVKYIKEFNAILKDNYLIYEFFIPCHVTATQQMKMISVASYDPTYYTAIFFTQGDPVILRNDDAFEIKTAIREDPDTKIYFDMIHPWTLFMEFRKKP